MIVGFDKVDQSQGIGSIKNQVSGFLQAVGYLKGNLAICA